MAEKYFFNVPVDYNASERLDSYICSNLISEKSTLTRSQVKAQVKSILVNGKEKKLSYKVSTNDRIEIELESKKPVKLNGVSKAELIEYPVFNNLSNSSHTVTITVKGYTPHVAIAAFVTTKP